MATKAIANEGDRGVSRSAIAGAAGPSVWLRGSCGSEPVTGPSSPFAVATGLLQTGRASGSESYSPPRRHAHSRTRFCWRALITSDGSRHVGLSTLLDLRMSLIRGGIGQGAGMTDRDELGGRSPGGDADRKREIRSALPTWARTKIGLRSCQPGVTFARPSDVADSSGIARARHDSTATSSEDDPPR